MDAVGLLEVESFATAIVATDAMLKTAQVSLLSQQEIRPGIVTVIVAGDLAACHAAVDAGVAVVSRIQQKVRHHVIGRLDEDERLNQLVLGGYLCTPKACKKPFLKKEVSAALSVLPQTTSDEPLLAFIKSNPQGKTIPQIAQHFDQTISLVRSHLKPLVSSGILIKDKLYYTVSKIEG